MKKVSSNCGNSKGKSISGSKLNHKETKGYRPSGPDTGTSCTPPNIGTSVKNIKK